jgi:putative ABC transport system ATP-binding protein
MKTIEARNLVKVYRMGENDLIALKGITLTIDKGEFVAITGYSGSGKSTLMHLLGCLDTPTEGDYFIDGINVSTSTRNELAQIRNQKIGFVFQKFHLLPDLTALDNVALPMLYAGSGEAEARTRAAELLTMVDLKNRLTHYPYQLSGGQQQRVAIARSLINKPSIILADEPTGNLDSQTGDVIMEMLRKLNTEQQTTIIIVTHEPYIAAKTRRIIELIDGNIKSDKPVDTNNTPHIENLSHE